MSNARVVRDARLKAGLSQGQVAGQAQIDVLELRQLEAGQPIREESLARIAVALGMDPAALTEQQRREVMHIHVLGREPQKTQAPVPEGKPKYIAPDPEEDEFLEPPVENPARHGGESVHFGGQSQRDAAPARMVEPPWGEIEPMQQETGLEQREKIHFGAVSGGAVPARESDAPARAVYTPPVEYEGDRKSLNREFLAMMVDLAQLTQWDVVMEMGAAEGELSRMIAPRCQQLVAIDASERMVDRNHSISRRSNINNIDCYVADARDTRFDAESFDVVFVNMLLHHVVKPESVIREAMRLLRPGGRLVIAELSAAERDEYAPLQNAMEVLRNPTHIRLLDLPKLVKLVGAQQFTVLDKRILTQSCEYNKWADAMGMKSKNGPLRALMQSMAHQGNEAGINLRTQGGEIHFDMTWMYVLAQKAGA